MKKTFKKVSNHGGNNDGHKYGCSWSFNNTHRYAIYSVNIYGSVLFMYALLRETLNKYWKFKYNKIISVTWHVEDFSGK